MTWLRKIAEFYYDGFRAMTVGKTLWAVIIVKLVILFLVLKLFFFPDALSGMDDGQKADFVSRELIER
ncbi:DUF4492 domain-containing protein [uncultured Rikenella sp.]|uniref:DUF4492 domain-containing protein n=1 Tax=uncultured Rikenella sp. TaxID=368003 RepID=UPI0025D06525|nr:DUF4492 domain-containing protein [uncultured Rikenella sp.]